MQSEVESDDTDKLAHVPLHSSQKTEVGEYVKLDNGTGLCYVQGLNGEGKTYVVLYSDVTIPEDIGNHELLDVPFSTDCDAASFFT